MYIPCDKYLVLMLDLHLNATSCFFFQFSFHKVIRDKIQIKYSIVYDLRGKRTKKNIMMYNSSAKTNIKKRKLSHARVSLNTIIQTQS